MIYKLWLSAYDCGDGSFNVILNNTKEEALESINQTEESLEQGNFYENGMIEEVMIDLDENGKLKKPFYINIE